MTGPIDGEGNMKGFDPSGCKPDEGDATQDPLFSVAPQIDWEAIMRRVIPGAGEGEQERLRELSEDVDHPHISLSHIDKKYPKSIRSEFQDKHIILNKKFHENDLEEGFDFEQYGTPRVRPSFGDLQPPMLPRVPEETFDWPPRSMSFDPAAALSLPEDGLRMSEPWKDIPEVFPDQWGTDPAFFRLGDDRPAEPPPHIIAEMDAEQRARRLAFGSDLTQQDIQDLMDSVQRRQLEEREQLIDRILGSQSVSEPDYKEQYKKYLQDQGILDDFPPQEEEK